MDALLRDKSLLGRVQGRWSRTHVGAENPCRSTALFVEAIWGRWASGADWILDHLRKLDVGCGSVERLEGEGGETSSSSATGRGMCDVQELARESGEAGLTRQQSRRAVTPLTPKSVREASILETEGAVSLIPHRVVPIVSPWSTDPDVAEAGSPSDLSSSLSFACMRESSEMSRRRRRGSWSRRGF